MSKISQRKPHESQEFPNSGGSNEGMKGTPSNITRVLSSSTDTSALTHFDVCRGSSHLSRAVVPTIRLERKNRKLMRALNCLVTNMSDALSRHARGLCDEPSLCIPLSEDSALYQWRSEYDPAQRSKWLGHAAVRAAVRQLEFGGWLTVERGFRVSDQLRRPSVLTPTYQLATLWQALQGDPGGVSVETQPDLIVHMGLVDISPLEGQTEVHLTHRDIAIKNRMNRKLQRLNRLQTSFHWTLDRLDLIPGGAADLVDALGTIRPSALIYRRVFTDGSLERGGRYYATISSAIQRHLRRHLRVDGKPLVEADFSAMHVYCAYALAGIEPPAGDPYRKGELASLYRPAVKAVMLNMLNWGSVKKDGGVSLQGFHGAIWNAWDVSRRKDEADRAHCELLGLPPEGSPLPEKLDAELINICRETVLAEHAPIADYLMRNWGTRFQYVDSCIAERVADRFIELKAPLFILHDGFFTTPEFEGDLVAAMRAAFRAELKVNWLPGIKVKRLGDLLG